MARDIFNDKGETSARGAARYLDIGEMQVSQLLRKGKIPGATKVDGKWTMTQANLDAYLAAGPAPRGNAAQGLFKVTGWVSAEGLEQLISAGWNFKKVEKKAKKDKAAEPTE